MTEDEEERLQQSLKALDERYIQRRLVAVNKLPDPDGTSCSFCGKGPTEYQDIIQGPDVRICGECVELCVDVLKEMREERGT